MEVAVREPVRGFAELGGLKVPKVVQAARWAFRPLEFLEWGARTHGDLFRLETPGLPPVVAVHNPRHVEAIFGAGVEELSAGKANAVLRQILGPASVILLDGERHKRQRKLLMPPFHGERMHRYGEVMRQAALSSMRRWPRGQPFSLQREFQHVALDVILRAVFGVEGEAHRELRDALDGFLSVGTHPAAFFVMLWAGPDGVVRVQKLLEALTPYGRMARYQAEVDRLLRREIASRRASGASGDDILTLLLSARDEAGAPLTEDELRDEMLTLVLAGHETTATALTWAVHLLLRNPAALAKLRAELTALGESPAPEAIAKSEYLDVVIKESMRLQPVIPIVARELEQPLRLDGWELPAGILVTPAVYLTHRRPDVWEQPLEFRPERFLSRRASPYEFYPFGGGLRRCVGMAFALYEMKLVLAELVTRAELTVAPGYAGRTVRRGVTVSLDGGLPVIVSNVRA